MCIFRGKAIGSFCSLCRQCEAYLETCSPIVVNSGFVAGECDFCFCDLCPAYSACEEIWEKGGVDSEVIEF